MLNKSKAFVSPRKKQPEQQAQLVQQEEAFDMTGEGTSEKRQGLRFSDNEEVLAHWNGAEWVSGIVVTGDADVEDGPYYLVYDSWFFFVH
jgi:hypothetical protein